MAHNANPGNALRCNGVLQDVNGPARVRKVESAGKEVGDVGENRYLCRIIGRRDAIRPIHHVIYIGEIPVCT